MQHNTAVFTALGLIVVILTARNESVSTALKSQTASMFSPVQSVTSTALGAVFGSSGTPSLEAGAAAPALVSRALAEQAAPAYVEENAYLKNLLKVQHSSELPLVAGRVVTRDGFTGWYSVVTVDVGRSNGVEIGQLVLGCILPQRTGESFRCGVIGKVTAVGRRSCEVTLITSPRTQNSLFCSVPARHATGILLGPPPEPGRPTKPALLLPHPLSRLQHLQNGDRVQVGDEVYASSYSTSVNHPLTVGHITKVDHDSSGYPVSIEVTPAVDLSSITYVFVCTAPPVTPPSGAQDMAAR